GEPVEKYIVERAFDEVLIIPQISPREILLVKQFRRGVREILLELPGGKIREGESELAAAHRELEEETGYRAEKLEKLSENFVAPSWSTPKQTFFFARELAPVEHPKSPDPDENIEVVKLSFEEALAKAESGEIKDAKTILGLFLAKKFFTTIEVRCYKGTL
ncbi:MAG: NUDIX hydrolase, partial [candidate division WWE3 bacterium]|nr:NUDIX hydrolase [candidate division WWE3 bacterium]